MMANLEAMIDDKSLQMKSFSSGGKTYTVAEADNFSYTDPIDNSVSTKQVVIRSRTWGEKKDGGRSGEWRVGVGWGGGVQFRFG